MKPTYIAIAIIVLALIGGLAASLLRSPSESGIPAAAGSDWRLTKLTGGEGTLSDYKGQVVLINFWASWCGTCREEMPDIVQTWRDYKDRGFTVVGINYDEGEKDARDFAQSYGMDFPTFFDPGKKIAGQYGVISMPSSYLINRRGEVKVFIPGKINFSELRPAVEQMLAEAQ